MRFKLIPALLSAALVSTVSAFAADQVRISEFAAINTGPLRDADGELSDWIEIHNFGTNTVNLANWSLTDSAGNPTKWQFPATNIPPNGYMVVFASNNDRRTAGRELHTNFRLNDEGEYLGLVRPDGTVASAFAPTFPPQISRVTFGIPLTQVSSTLIATGAAARVRVPTDDSLGQSWIAPDFNDSGWTPAQTGIGFDTALDGTNEIVADSIADWSTGGVQGEKNWYYGYYNRTADAGGIYHVTNFTAFPRDNGPSGPGNFWTGTMWDWFAGNPPWDEVGQQNMHPNGINNAAEHWVIRRWASEVSGTIHVQWRMAKANLSGGGVTGRVLHNGVQKDTAVIAGADGVGVNRTITISNVNVGDFIDIALDPTGVGGDTGDGADGSVMSAVIRGAVSLTSSIATDIGSAMRDVNAGAYIRIPFTVTDASAVRVLTLRMKYDDGFVANINGVFVADRHPPLQGNPLTWNSSASTNRFDGDANQWDEIDLSEYVATLREGANVLAIHGLNASASDGDFLVLPELRAAFAGADQAPAYFTSPTPGAANGAGSTNIGPVINEVVHTPNVPQDNQDLAVTARVTPTFNPVGTVRLIYRVMFGNEVTLPMLDDGANGDGLAADGVYGAVIPASAARIGEMVRYYIHATDVRSNQMRFPIYDPIVNAANAPQYRGTIVDVPQTNGLPIFHLFIPDNILQQANNNSANTPRYPCSLFYLGEFYDNCAINRHGQSSAGFPKKSYDIDFNPGHSFKWKDGEDRVDDINMLTTYPDKSQMRNILGYEIFKDAGAPYHFVEPVRMQTNGGFYGTWHMVENGDDNFLSRIGRDPNGALYKMYNTFTDPSDYTISSAEAEKKTRKTEGNADLVALFNGVNNPSLSVRTNFMYDNIDIAEVLNQAASRSLTSDWDCCHKNYYLYRDSDGTGEWQAMPWDIDLSFGRNWSSSQTYWDDTVYPANRVWGNWDNNAFFQVVLNMPAGRGIDATRQMYLRRIRTLMDEIQQTNGTPYAQLRFENQMDAAAARIKADAAMDLLKWGTWGGGGTGIFDTNNPFYRSVPQEVDRLKTNFLPARRAFIFNQFMNLSGGDLVNFTNSQPTNVVILIGAVDYNPTSSNQAEEYIELINTNRIAVDISGWKLSGGIEHTFQGGVVIPSSNRVYVVSDKKAFRNRAVAPRGGMGLYVEGAFKGQLSARGESLVLTDKRGRLVVSNAFVGAPSLAQQYLRITEVMYAPVAVGSGSPYVREDFEYVELKNIGPVAINLTGVHFTNGIEFAFSPATTTNLAAGASIILARNPAAFASRYPSVTVPVYAYLGSLDNAGERIQLDDAVGEKILEFTYNNSWYPMTDGNGLSLVIADELAPFYMWDRKEGWRPSSGYNGSPAQVDPPAVTFAAVLVNEVLAHTDLPAVDAIELWNPTTNAVDVGNWLLSDDFFAPGKYRITAPRVIPAGGYLVLTEADFNAGGAGFSFSSQGDEAYLFSGDASGNPNGYFHGFEFGASETGVSLGRHTNSQGEIHFVAQSSNTFGDVNALPKVGPIVVSEFMYHPPDVDGQDNALDEFIELQNLTGVAVPLYDVANRTNGWRLDDAVEYTFSTNDVVPADGFLLVVNFNPVTNAAALARFRSIYNVPVGVPIVGPYAGKLDNNGRRPDGSGESVELYKPDAPETNGVPYVLVEQVDYSDALPWNGAAAGFGPSLQRKLVTAYANDATNWTAGLPSAGRVPFSGDAPVITQQPQGVVGTEGIPASVSVTVSGTAPFGYQWFRNGQSLGGETSATLSFASPTPDQNGSYSVVVFNGAGAVFSSNASVVIRPLPVIVSQPQSQNVRSGTNVTVSVGVNGTGTVRYQWSFNGTPIAGATNAAYSFSNAQLFVHSGEYSVFVQDDVSSLASQPARIVVLVNPGITNQPVPQTVAQGQTARFMVVAGPEHPMLPLTFRWLRNGVTWPSDGTATLVIPNCQSNGTYRVVITNLAGSVNSVSVALTVLPDADGDGIPDAWEQQYFGNATNTPGDVDSDGDGMINSAEFVAGTDPTNALSVLKIMIHATNHNLLTFVAQTNRGYTVQYQTNLATDFWTSVTNVGASSQVRTMQMHAPNPPPDADRFYRVVTPPAP